jgi:DNA topoisomerase-1
MRALEKLQRHGLRRVGTPKMGFRYVRRDGRPVAAPDVERLRALRLPPAWTDVFISPAPTAKLQAIGKDKAGRWQYRYHPEFVRSRAAAKYRRLLRFAEALPKIRNAVDRDMRKRGLKRDRVLAGMIRILEACAMRPGSEAYARDNGSFGLATIRPRHVTVTGDKVTFDYRGKSGQQQVRELRDARVARLVRECLRVPGRDVFKFLEDGEVIDVRRRHLNEYVRGKAGAAFTAKDFRTWAGTLLCASELAQRAQELVPGRTSRKRLANAAVKAVAERLGNTPAVARGSYISPAVLDGFERGEVVASCLRPDDVLGLNVPRSGLHDAERALVTFLRAATGDRKGGPKLRVLRGGSDEDARGELVRPKPAGGVGKPVGRAARGPER